MVEIKRAARVWSGARAQAAPRKVMQKRWQNVGVEGSVFVATTSAGNGAVCDHLMGRERRESRSHHDSMAPIQPLAIAQSASASSRRQHRRSVTLSSALLCLALILASTASQRAACGLTLSRRRHRSSQ
ncbi:uncharacterized protein CC84DRAFT_53410 [Paraphaeosphaeria sporulosa]|uniref:Uncharacterized protein n=1 Tax=Paraphaeosphaeria sporulosa TaxID=1460663 RepID=A0A177CW58_9PLEO|nr:uncharacterized protein CC84DRAFT_53410 [Paraphaeosphaeria sporulosa]OAG11794.1 hypothetical protein CC84DRAFT_53410 [Paraphaeosphaeria sporulosa]